MKAGILSFLFIILSSCGGIERPEVSKIGSSPIVPEKTVAEVVEEIQEESLIYYDFESWIPDYVNIVPGDLIGTDNKTLSLNQNGATNQYIQTPIDLMTYSAFTMAIWFKTTDITRIQTIFWQGVGTQNGWGNAGDPSVGEFNININHFTHSDGTAVSAFYGYNDQLPTAINFPYSYDGTPNGPMANLINHQWYHIAVVILNDGNQVEIKTYLDGNFIQSQVGTQMDNTFWNTNFRIGRPGADTRKFTGELDSFLVIDRELTATEINKVYQNGR